MAEKKRKEEKQTRKFILLVESNGKIVKNDSSKSATPLKIEKGHMLEEVTNPKIRDTVLGLYKQELSGKALAERLLLVSCFQNNLYTCSPQSHCAQLSSLEAHLLLAVDSSSERFTAYQIPSFLVEAARVGVGSEIRCSVDFPRSEKAPTQEWMDGTVVWIGSLGPKRLGTYFGVILAYPGWGETDGSFEGRRLFTAPEKGGVFVAANRIRLKNTNSPAWTPLNWSPVEENPSTPDSDLEGWEKVEKMQNETNDALMGMKEHKPSLSVGERVVWPSPDGQMELGTVKWLGKLPIPRHRHEWHAGVQFDRPIGGGTGKYQGKELFHTPPNHASLIPLMGLIRKKDFTLTASDSEKTRLSKKSAVETLSYKEKKEDQMPKKNSEKQLKRRESLDHHFGIGTCVEVSLSVSPEPMFGVVRWVGVLPVAPNQHMNMVGLELEENLPIDWGEPSEGIYQGVRYFSCPPRRGLFAPTSQLRIDHRFNTPIMSLHEFGGVDSGVVEEYTPVAEHPLLEQCAPRKGIQGHRNSCYLDATLFAMFAHTSTFDNLLLRPETKNDISEYSTLVNLLAMEIVYPLRKFGYVRADRVVRFREMLSELLPDIQGLTEEEKDPEELLNALFQRLLKAKPFLHFNSGGKPEKAYLCQLVLDEKLPGALPNVQFLLERSFFTSNLKLEKVPQPCLIIQLPRYGKEKIYPYTLPPAELDLTHVMMNNPRPCGRCGQLAEVECGECYLTAASNLSDATFCCECFSKFHESLPKEIGDHCPAKLQVSPLARQALSLEPRGQIPPVTMQLVSVLCIETSHYVAYTRTKDDQWLFFDSMADRKGDSDGYNIPDVSYCVDLTALLGTNLSGEVEAGRVGDLPRFLKRFLKDCYICFYVWPLARYFT